MTHIFNFRCIPSIQIKFIFTLFSRQISWYAKWKFIKHVFHILYVTYIPFINIHNRTTFPKHITHIFHFTCIPWWQIMHILKNIIVCITRNSGTYKHTFHICNIWYIKTFQINIHRCHDKHFFHICNFWCIPIINWCIMMANRHKHSFHIGYIWYIPLTNIIFKLYMFIATIIIMIFYWFISFFILIKKITHISHFWRIPFFRFSIFFFCGFTFIIIYVSTKRIICVTCMFINAIFYCIPKGFIGMYVTHNLSLECMILYT